MLLRVFNAFRLAETTSAAGDARSAFVAHGLAEMGTRSLMPSRSKDLRAKQLNLPSMALAWFGLTLMTACSDGPSTYRYRLTVEIETPQGLRSGSSVFEVQERFVLPGGSPSSYGIARRARGEAAAIDLPDGQTLFALVRHESTADWAAYLMTHVLPDFDGGLVKEQLDKLPRPNDAMVVPRERSTGGIDKTSNYPLLAVFSDINDPSSIKLVDPNNLHRVFGQGVALKRVTVQYTNDPMTNSIDKRLPWLKERAQLGGYLIPMVRGKNGFFEASPGYDDSITFLGVSYFSTEAFR